MTTKLNDFIIGALPGCRVVLTLPPVSGQHAHCTWDGHSWWISDLGSTNGTSVDGQIVGRDPVQVSLSSLVGLGSAVLGFDALLVLATAGSYQRHWTVGAGSDCDIVLDQARISTHHARVYLCDNAFILVDLNSTNGTVVDGARLGGHPVSVTLRSSIALAGEAIRFPMLLEPEEARRTGSGSVQQVPPGSYLVGAASYCACQIDAPSVSSKHALLQVTSAGCRLVDIGSANGTTVDGRRLTAEPTPIVAGSQISLGSHPLTLVDLLDRIETEAPTRVVGAHPACDWVPDDASVSTLHAAVMRHPRGLVLIDLGSSNGVRCDGEPIERTPLRQSSTVVIGAQRLTGAELASKVGWQWPQVRGKSQASAPSVVVAVSIPAADGRGSPQGTSKPLPKTSQPRAAPPPTITHTRTPEPVEVDDEPYPMEAQAAPTFALSAVGCFMMLALLGAVGFGLHLATNQSSGGQVVDDDPPGPPPPQPSPVPAPNDGLPGRSAWQTLRTAGDRATQQQSQNKFASLSLAAVDRDLDKASGAPISSWIAPKPDLADHLRTLQRPSSEHDAKKYKLVDANRFNKQGGGSLGAAPRPGRDRFLVPNLGRIPVRDQSKRGTCAAFAGIGNIEYAVLRQFPRLKRPLNLSEQYFYYLAKPTCQDGSCRNRSEEGSSYHTGFSESRSNAGLDIPLERDCRYRGTWRRNDVQAPLPNSCGRGAVDVVQTRVLRSLGDIVASLERDRVPIPIGTRLSDTWQKGGSRFISLRNSGRPDPSKHSGGHAYLIVGYRRVPNMPEEGGLCFYVKNSWGRGWARGGYSCVTQAWLQSYGRGRLVTQVVTEVRLHESLQPSKPPAPKPPPKPAPAPKWRAVRLQGPEQATYFAEMKQQGTSVALRGVVASDGRRTQPAALVRSGGRLYYSGVQVGRIKSGTYVLCAGPYDAVCALRYLPQGRRLVVHIRDRSYGHTLASSKSPVPFVPILPIPGLGRIEVQPPTAKAAGSVSVRVRFVPDNGAPTAELELAVTNEFDLMVAGRTVGSFHPDRMGLCTGKYLAACDMFVDADGLSILPYKGQ